MSTAAGSRTRSEGGQPHNTRCQANRNANCVVLSWLSLATQQRMRLIVCLMHVVPFPLLQLWCPLSLASSGWLVPASYLLTCEDVVAEARVAVLERQACAGQSLHSC